MILCFQNMAHLILQKYYNCIVSKHGRPSSWPRSVLSRLVRRFACPPNVLPASPRRLSDRCLSYCSQSCYTRSFHFVFAVLQVRVAGYSGYLDGTVEICNWLKFIRSTNDGSGQNVRAFLLAGQVPNDEDDDGWLFSRQPRYVGTVDRLCNVYIFHSTFSFSK